VRKFETKIFDPENKIRFCQNTNYYQKLEGYAFVIQILDGCLKFIYALVLVVTIIMFISGLAFVGGILAIVQFASEDSLNELLG
jgi:hypothetical protein